MNSQFRSELYSRALNRAGIEPMPGNTNATDAVPERKPLTPAAQRALAEAEARRQAAEASTKPGPKESGGPKGPEPTRYGDWENKGIASDF